MAKTKAVDESLSLIEKAQRGLLKRLQKMVDDGASKADLDKVAVHAAVIAVISNSVVWKPPILL